jgi:nitroreductase
MPAKEIAELVRTSPLLILVLMNRTRRPPGEGGQRWMWLAMGATIQNMLLAATTLHIGTQFVSAPLECQADREQIQKIFSLPEGCEIITLLRLGYVDSIRGKSVRVHPSTFVRYENYTEAVPYTANNG